MTDFDPYECLIQTRLQLQEIAELQRQTAHHIEQLWDAMARLQRRQQILAQYSGLLDRPSKDTSNE